MFNVTNHTNFGFTSAALFTGVDAIGNGIRNPGAGLIFPSSWENPKTSHIRAVIARER